MSPRTLRILLVLIGIAFVALTAWSLRYFAGTQPLAPLTQGYNQPGLGGIGLLATDVVVVGHSAGRRRWRMAAGTVTFSRDRRSLTVEGIRNGLLYDRLGKPQVSLSAARAAYQTPFGAMGFSSGANLRLDGQIRATILAAPRPILVTQSLVWDSFRNQISSPTPVSVTLPRLTVTAGSGTYALPPGLSPMEPRGTLTLTGNVRAILPHLSVSAGNAIYAPPPGTSAPASQGVLTAEGGVRGILQSARGTTLLSCPGLTWDGARDLAHSLGPVTVQIPGGSGTAADVVANTKTGDLTTHGFRGTFVLSGEVQ